MLFTMIDQIHDQSGQCLKYPPGALKDNIRKILNDHLFLSEFCITDWYFPIPKESLPQTRQLYHPDKAPEALKQSH
jgi:hypothetical protein